MSNTFKKLIRGGLILAILMLTATPALADQQSGESRVYYESLIKAPDLGNYQFKLESHEVPSHEWLPTISKDYFPKTIATFTTEVDNTAPSAVYKSKPIAKVDVVFAFGDMEQSKTMENYIPTFESKLNAAGNNIDAYVEKVETSTISSNDAGAAEIFTKWENYPDNTGQWTFDTSDNSIGSTRNVSWTGFWNNSEEALETEDVTIEYKSKEKLRVRNQNCLGVMCHPDPMGFTFRMTQENGEYSYYAFAIYAYQQIAILGRVDKVTSPNQAANILVAGFTSRIPNGVGQGGPVKQLAYKEIYYHPTMEHDIKIVCKKNHIQIYYDGDILFDYEDNPNDYLTHGGYGPFTYSTPNGNFYDIKITTGSSKSLGEAISDVSWRENSVKYIIYGEDKIPEYMENTDNADYQYTVTKILNSNAYMIGLGTSINRNVIQNLINNISEANNSKGEFMYNSPIITALNNSANRIIELARKFMKPTNYLLVNTQIAWETEYRDSERDLPLNFGEHDGTKNSDISDKTLANSWGVGLTHLYTQDKILAEKWRYRHINTFYDNSPIVESFSNVWIQDPVEIFTNPGLYRVNYKRRDNPFYTNTALNNPFDSYRYWSTDYDMNGGR